MSMITQYKNVVEKLYEEIITHESIKIIEISSKLSQSIINGGIAHIFGTGHSEMVGMEVFMRAGSLSCFRIIGMNYDLEKFERLEGMAEIIMADYEILPQELVIVVSSSGINSVPIEIAMKSKRKGAYVVALTSLAHSKSVESRHSSGRKLFEVADLVVDSHVPIGDAAVTFEELEMRVGPVSSLANIFIINSLVLETTDRIIKAGHTPPIRISRNLPQGDGHNQRFKDQYKERIPELIL